MAIMTDPEATIRLVAHDLHAMADRLRGVLDGQVRGLGAEAVLHGIRQQLDVWARGLDERWPPDAGR